MLMCQNKVMLGNNLIFLITCNSKIQGVVSNNFNINKGGI
jgi:hypothetical protein